MKAYDKVYVKKEKNNVVYSLSVQYDNGGEEYIRKDDLLEWVEEKKNELLSCEPSDIAAGINGGLDMIISKLNSM